MLSQKINKTQNCETFRNFKSVVVPNTAVPKIYVLKWTIRTEGLEKIFWLDILMHHYCENNETKSKISRDSHSSGNNKKPFSDNYSFQQSVHNRHPTAALLIILLKRMIYILYISVIFYPSISCPQHNFIVKFLNFFVNKLNADIMFKIHSKI